jgi:hypothetical protein
MKWKCIYRSACVAGSAVAAILFGMSSGTNASEHTLPLNLRTWKLEYTLTGGIAGVNRHCVLTHVGELTADDERIGNRASGAADEQLMKKVKAWLPVARQAKPERASPYTADALLASAAVTTGGQHYQLDLPDEIARILNNAMDNLFQQEVLGT